MSATTEKLAELSRMRREARLTLHDAYTLIRLAEEKLLSAESNLPVSDEGSRNAVDCITGMTASSRVLLADVLTKVGSQ